MIIRDATPADMAEVGEIRITAYEAGGFLAGDSGYRPYLRALGSDGSGVVLVAVGPGPASRGQPGDSVIGTVMLHLWPHAGPAVNSQDEAEIRALAVAPGAQRSGVGRALVEAVIARAAQAGVRHLILSTQPDMLAAHRLYERSGFVRLPGRDWSPVPEVSLLVYSLRLA